MDIFYTLVALVHLASGQPFPVYDTENEYTTRAECLENASDFNVGLMIMMRRLPITKVEVWCEERDPHKDDEVA